MINCFASILPYGMGSNVILIVIGLLSLLSFAIFIERMIFLKKADTDTNLLLLNLRKDIDEGNFVSAMKTCELSGGSIARIVKAALMKHARTREQMESAIELQGMIEIAALERNGKVLSVIAHLAPLIGLLGTVVGFIQAFSEMKTSGLVDISASQIGEAMEFALVTTAAGLVVAIPSVIGYNYLVSRIDGFLLDMQTTSQEVLDLLLNRDEY